MGKEVGGHSEMYTVSFQGPWQWFSARAPTPLPEVGIFRRGQAELGLFSTDNCLCCTFPGIHYRNPLLLTRGPFPLGRPRVGKW